MAVWLSSVFNAPFAIRSIRNIVFTNWPFFSFFMQELTAHKQGIKSSVSLTVFHQQRSPTAVFMLVFVCGDECTGARFTKEIQQTLRLTMNSELI